MASNSKEEVNKPATPEQIEEYKRLKLRNEWIKINQKKLDEIESNKLRHVKIVELLVFINIVINLLFLLL